MIGNKQAANAGDRERGAELSTKNGSDIFSSRTRGFLHFDDYNHFDDYYVEGICNHFYPQRSLALPHEPVPKLYWMILGCL